MRDKKLVNSIERYCNESSFPYSVYFSEVVPDARFKGYKYFFKYHNTHNVHIAFRNQKDMREYLRGLGY